MTYTCAMCGETFESGWTDAEAQAEALRDFGPIPKTDQRLVCDVCYEKFKPSQQPERYRRWLEWKNQQNQKQ